MKHGDKRPIIIRRKKVAHAAHHGGAWKVAYADFVTAMMAFFMVMWIIGMDPNVRSSIEGYFSNPIGFKKGYSAGKSPLSSGSSPSEVQTAPLHLMSRAAEEQEMGNVSTRIRDKLDKAGLGMLAKNMEIIQTPTGLRLEIAEDSSGDMFFPVASSAMKPALTQALGVIGAVFAPLRNPIIIEGHTDAMPYSGLYSNWDLSTDRANAALHVLERSGIDPTRIMEVVGHADRELRIKDNPLDPRNRRISIMLPFVTPPDSSTIAGK